MHHDATDGKPCSIACNANTRACMPCQTEPQTMLQSALLHTGSIPRVTYHMVHACQQPCSTKSVHVYCIHDKLMQHSPDNPQLSTFACMQKYAFRSKDVIQMHDCARALWRVPCANRCRPELTHDYLFVTILVQTSKRFHIQTE